MDQPMTPIPYEHDPDDLEQALHAAQVGSATHWPTVAAILRDEIIRLRAMYSAPQRAAPEPPKRTVEWYIAYCQECDMKMPFYDSDERYGWAQQHAQAHEGGFVIGPWEEVSA